MHESFEYVNCNLCGKDSTAVLYESTLPQDLTVALTARFAPSDHISGHDRVVKCVGCGLMYANPRMKPGYIWEGYSRADDHKYATQSEERTRTFRRIKAVRLKKEIILVNDESRDSSLSILDEIKSHQPEEYCERIVVIHKKNGGKGSALKEGIRAASGVIFSFGSRRLAQFAGLIFMLILGPLKIFDFFFARLPGADAVAAQLYPVRSLKAPALPR